MGKKKLKENPSLLEVKAYKSKTHPAPFEEYPLALGGGYIFEKRFTYFGKFVLFLDALVSAYFYLSLAFFFSWFLNKYTVRDLDESQSKWLILGEIIGQSLTMVIALIATIVIVPKIFPNVYPGPPVIHLVYKAYIGGVLATFGLFAAESKLSKKIRYVFDTKDYENIYKK